jgi:hypothetical protein
MKFNRIDWDLKALIGIYCDGMVVCVGDLMRLIGI